MTCKSYILQPTSLLTFSFVARRGELPNARKPACLVIDKLIHHKYGLGDLPRKQVRLVLAWAELHQEELMADWRLVMNGEEPFKIQPLQ
jgi:hypothetical protein